MSYIVTRISCLADVSFKLEKKKMRAVGPGAIDIIELGGFSTVVGAGSYVFIANGAASIKEGTSIYKIGSKSISVIKRKPESILINGVDYIKDWNDSLVSLE